MKKALLLATIIGLVLCLAAPGALAKKLVVVKDSPPRTMDPMGSDADSNLTFMANFFDALLQRPGAEGTLSPALATKYERLDANSWKFYLRKGVKFHNGNPFTAQDVAFTFKRLADPQVSEFINTGKNIENVEIIDDYTVIIHTKTTVPWFDQVAYLFSIMDKESTENADPAEVGLKPNGTGAYKMVEWVKGSYLKMAANADWWGGKPAVDEVEVRPITESSTRFAALASGQADILWGVPIEMYKQVEKNPKVEIVSRPARRGMFLALTNKPGTPMADIRVRKAMAMAINEDEIIEKVMRGQATKAAQVPDPITTGYNPDIKRYEYNLAEAKRLMKEAGYENGFEIVVAGPTDRYVQDEKICEAVVKYLAKINIKAGLDVKPKSIFFPEVAKGKHQMYFLGWFDSSSDMGRTFSKLIHTYDEERGFGAWNGTRYSDPELDKMIEENMKIVDIDERKAYLMKMNKIAMEDKLAFLPLHYQVDVYAIQKNKGIKFTPRPDRWMVCSELDIK